ncbi:MAG: pirin family protein [Culicoidibacterales bacterium]
MNHGWLDSHFHFSFAEYYNPQRMRFGVLRVVNDDYILPNHGFELHPHRDMEIISYVIEGALAHGDSLGHEKIIQAGDFQYMSAGTGVEHSEHNHGDERTRILQMWIFPDKKGVKPRYGDVKITDYQQLNQWYHVVSPDETRAPITLHQDVNIHVLQLEAGKTLAYPLHEGRQAYLIQISGDALINETVTLGFGDSIEISDVPLLYTAQTLSHVLVIEMAKG